MKCILSPHSRILVLFSVNISREKKKKEEKVKSNFIHQYKDLYILNPATMETSSSLMNLISYFS